MQRSDSLPAGVPRFAACRPHLLAALLSCSNAYRRGRARIFLILLLALAVAGGVIEIPATALILGWLGRNVVVTVIFAACLCGVSMLRRRERAAAAAADSWLAALPAPSPVSLLVVWSLGAQLLLAVLFVALAFLLGRLDATATWRLILALLGGTVLGSLAGWRLRWAPDEGKPGFHYAIVRRARARWATAPSLLPLSYWPVAQGRIFGRPKALSRVAFLMLITLPLGTPGQAALAIAVAAMGVLSMMSLSLAASRVALAAARWLAPTPLGRGRFTAGMVWRVTVIQVLTTAAMIFLACAIDLSKALRLGVYLGAGFLIVSLVVAAVACAWACRRVGLGAASRGAPPHGQPAV